MATDPSSDRHKVTRIRESGAERRKRVKEEEEKNAKLISKTRRLTDYIQVGASGSCSHHLGVPVVVDVNTDHEESAIFLCRFAEKKARRVPLH